MDNLRPTFRLSWLWFFVMAILAGWPFFGMPNHLESLLYVVFFWITLATSWNLMSGYSGYFSFGHGAFFGIGMYGMATFAGKFGFGFWPSAFLSGICASILALALGALVFRLKKIRGESFALITLAVTFVLATLIVNTPIDGGPGVYLMGVQVPMIGPSASSTFYLLGFVMVVTSVWSSRALFYSQSGLGLLAIHDDEDVAEVHGVPTFALKMKAFALSGFFAGMMGSIHALYVSYVTVSETFSITVPLTVVLMSILGGARQWAGPMLGAVLITFLLNAFTEGTSALYGRILIGVILTLSVLIMPEGLLGTWQAKQRKRSLTNKKTFEHDHLASDHNSSQTLLVNDLKLRDIRQELLIAQNQSEQSGHSTTLPNTSHSEPKEVVLELNGVCKYFAGIKALDGVNLTLHKGEILGLLGPNGSGKSTLINVVTGHLTPTAGSIKLLGQECAGQSAHLIRRIGVSRTYQIPRPFKGLTVLQNVLLSAQFGAQAVSDEKAQQLALEWIEFTGLSAKKDDYPDDLNLHQRKFLELARALAAQPAVIMLDEVLSGLTPSEIDMAVQTIRLIRSQGTSIVFVEHVMSAVMALSDRLVVLDQGRVIASGEPQDVMRQDVVVKAYLGDQAEVI
jgi:branched-chain amino acid transport system permease protein